MVRSLTGALALLLTSACVAEHPKDHFTAVTPTNFDRGGAVSRQFHLNAESYFRSATIASLGHSEELTSVPSQALAGTLVTHKGSQSSFANYVAADPLLDGVIVLHQGNIVFETYPNMQQWQRHYAWSVTKVVTATALAVLDQRQQIDMSAPVDDYVEALAGSAWANISIQDIANMASGIDCLDSDGYQTSTTCIYALEESLGITAPTGRTLDFIKQLRGMKSHRIAGTQVEYVSANTAVLTLLIEAVTGQPYARAIQELVWNPIAAESDALVTISKAGYAYGAGGLSARLRDIARFGQIYAQPKRSNVLRTATVQEIENAGVALPPESFERLRTLFGIDLPQRSGWQWDLIWADGAAYKGGYLGQGLYVDRPRDLVIAWFGTGLDYNATINSMLSVSRQIARSDWLENDLHNPN